MSSGRVRFRRQSDKTVKAATVDLNGDGKPETIRLTPIPSSGSQPLRFTLTINGVSVTGKFNDFPEECPGFEVVQLTSSSKRREIMVVGLGANDFHETAFYAWDGSRPKLLGLVPTIPDIKGNGVAYAAIWMGFWTRHEKFAFDDRTGLLAPVPQPFYYVGLKAKVRATFPIRHAPANTAPTVASVAPGSEAELLLYQSTPAHLGKMGYSGENDWYLVKSETGLCGWARMKQLQDNLINLPFAG